MSEPVKRYVTTCDCMSEAVWGDYVRQDDYAQLSQECERLSNELNNMRISWGLMQSERAAALNQVAGFLADKAAIDLLNQYIVTAEHPETGKTAICADSGTLRDCMEAALSAKP